MSLRKFFSLLVVLGILAASYFLFIGDTYPAATTGSLIVVNKGSRTYTVLDLQYGTIIEERAIDGEPHEATTTHSGKIVLTNFGNEIIQGRTLSIIDPQQDFEETVFDLGAGSKPHGIVNIPGSEDVLVTKYIGSELVKVNIKDKEVRARISLNQALSNLVAISPDGSRAYVANSNSVSVINLESDTLIETILCGQGIEGIDVSPDGQQVWVTSIYEKSIFIINSASNTIVDTITSEYQPTRLKFTVDGSYCLVTNSEDGRLSIYDVTSKKQVKVLVLPGDGGWFDRLIHHSPRPVGLLVHPDGKYAYVTNSNANKVEIIDLAEQKFVYSLPVGEIPDGMSILE